MGNDWDDAQDAHRSVYEGHHEGKLTHELAAGAAAFEGFKLFEDHQRKQGKPVSHAFAKEALAGVIGAEVDKLAETKGMDEWDRHKASQQAKEQAERMYDDHYINNQGADQYDPERYGRHQKFEGY